MPYFIETENQTWVNLEQVALLVPVLDKVTGSVLRYVCKTGDGTELGIVSVATMEADVLAMRMRGES